MKTEVVAKFLPKGQGLMPEMFTFACFLDGPNLNSPEPIIASVVDLFGADLGSPVKAALLDYKIGPIANEPWSREVQLIKAYPGPMQGLFVYFGGGGAGVPCIHFDRTDCAAEIYVCLSETTIMKTPGRVADLCMRLHTQCGKFAAQCVLAAGGEFLFSEGLSDASAALTEAIGPLSIAQWVACNVNAPAMDTGRFAEIKRSPPTILFRAH
jgi:hypothetical protein